MIDIRNDPPKFWGVGKLSGNFVLVGKFPSKNAKNWDLKPKFRRNFGTKLKFCAPIIYSVGNLQLSVLENRNFLPHLVLFNP